MNKKSVGLMILWWGEAIISVRVLLFSVPVMINKYSAKTFALSNPDDRFIVVITLTALLYFIVGVISVGGSKFAKTAHYLAVILVFALTAGSLSAFGQSLLSAEWHYITPLLFSVLITLLNIILGKAKKTA